MSLPCPNNCPVTFPTFGFVSKPECSGVGFEILLGSLHKPQHSLSASSTRAASSTCILWDFYTVKRFVKPGCPSCLSNCLKRGQTVKPNLHKTSVLDSVWLSLTFDFISFSIILDDLCRYA